jgi:bifunctional DNA-binding transcriptional regulator/antitoxin component of YhaV-PrlF toxin-antitoxin module
MTQLQKQLSRKTDDKEYAKWVVVIPPAAVKEAGLREGDELISIAGKGNILLKKTTKIVD